MRLVVFTTSQSQKTYVNADLVTHIMEAGTSSSTRLTRIFFGESSATNYLLVQGSLDTVAERLRSQGLD
jgi:hypothetical protein